MNMDLRKVIREVVVLMLQLVRWKPVSPDL